MTKAAPWSIKGVDFDVREAAKEAARRDGVSLGEWMNRAIADRAAEIGANAQEFDADERLEAVAAQLARLSQTPRDEETPRRRRGESDRRAEARPNDDDGREWAAREWAAREWAESARTTERVSRRSVAPERRPGRAAAGEPFMRRNSDAIRRGRLAHEGADAEALLEEAVAAFEEQANRVETRAARAMANVAQLIEASEEDRADTLAQVGARLREIEQRLNRGDKEATRPLRGVIATAHDWLGDVETRLARQERPSDDNSLRGALERLESRIEAMSRQSGHGADESSLRRLDGRLAALLARLDRPTPHSAAPQGQEGARALKGGVADVIGQIAARQRDLESGVRTPRPQTAQLTALLDERFEALARKFDAAAKGAAPAADHIDRLQTGLESLSGQIDAMRQDFAASGAQSRAELERLAGDLAARVDAALAAPQAADAQGLAARLDGLDALGRDIALLSRGVAEAAPRAAVTEIENAVRALSDRVDNAREAMLHAAATRPEPTSSAEIDALGEKIAAMTRALDDLAPRSQVASLEDAVRALTLRIERSREEGMREAVLAPIESLADDVRRALAEAGASAQFEGVSRQLREVEDKLEHLRHAGGGDRADFLQVHGQTDQIRAMLAEAMDKIAPIERLERQVGALSERLEEVARQNHDAGAAQVALPWGEIEARLSELALRIDRAPAPVDNSRFDDLAHRLDELHDTLAARIEDARAPARDNGPDQLEPLLRSLTEKLSAQPEPTIDSSAIEAIDRRIAEISRRLEQGGSQTEDRLQRAVEELTERLEALRESGREDRNAREISDLRERTEASDRLAQQTLSAVHETLEKVVDRLAMLEEDVIESRGAGEFAPRAPAPSGNARAAVKAAVDADDFLLEPGAGQPRDRQAGESPSLPRVAEMDDDEPALHFDAPRLGMGPESQPAAASYIDIARRALAARIAAESAEKPEKDQKRRPAAPEAEVGDNVRAAFVRPLAVSENAGSRRLPAILVAAASLLSFGAYEAYRLFDGPPPPMQAVLAPKADGARPADREPAASPAPSPGKASAAAPAPAAPTAPVAAPTAPLNGAPILPGNVVAPKPMTGASLPDPLATGSIGGPANTIAAIQAGAQARALKERAETGDTLAQFDYASRLASGRGVGQDQAAAVRWFEKAAAKGMAQAQFRLGAAYEKGIGAPRDARKAADYYEKAANQGHVRAMHNLGVVLAEGVNGKPDYAAAAQWFRRAAEYGLLDSQFNLAILYARGLGVPQDMGQSYVWFAVAAQQGDASAAKKRDEVAERLNAAALQQAQKEVAAFHAKTPSPAVNDQPQSAPGPAASAAL
jgi:localization factor PodJL